MKTTEDPSAIHELAGQAFDNPPLTPAGEYRVEWFELERFAALVRAQALEEAAQVCAERFAGEGVREARRCAAAIRALAGAPASESKLPQG